LKISTVQQDRSTAYPNVVYGMTTYIVKDSAWDTGIWTSPTYGSGAAESMIDTNSDVGGPNTQSFTNYKYPNYIGAPASAYFQVFAKPLVNLAVSAGLTYITGGTMAFTGVDAIMMLGGIASDAYTLSQEVPYTSDDAGWNSDLEASYQVVSEDGGYHQVME
jgi:hypothetical protein